MEKLFFWKSSVAISFKNSVIYYKYDLYKLDNYMIYMFKML